MTADMRTLMAIVEGAEDPFARLRPPPGVSPEAWLDRLGLRKLGRGTKAVVYALDDDLAVKLSLDPTDCWPQFVRLCQTRPQEHFPQVYWAQQGAGWFMAVLERLRPIPSNAFLDGRHDGMWAFIMTELEDTDAAVHLRFPFEAASGLYYRDHPQKFAAWAAPLAADFAARQPGLAAALRQVRTLRCKLDLNPGNFMLRGETLVITDPVNWEWPEGWSPRPIGPR